MYAENYKMLMKEIEKILINWEIYHVHGLKFSPNWYTDLTQLLTKSQGVFFF